MRVWLLVLVPCVPFIGCMVDESEDLGADGAAEMEFR
jgi:hypothetical protein